MFSSLTQATITASINKKSLSLDDILQLTIYADNISSNAVPDLTALLNNFDLMSSAQTQQVEMHNNRMTTVTVWTFTLLPKHEGQIIIPAINIGTQQTLAMTIMVTPAAKNNAKVVVNKLQENNITTPANVFLENTITPSSPYIQSEAIYTVSLYFNKEIAGPQLSDPESTDINFLRIGQEQAVQTKINNQWYQVIRINYAIFPQKSGAITIKGPSFNGNAVLLNAAGFVKGSQPVQAQAPDITIKVKPIPATYLNQWWLPAQDVQLSEQWRGDLSNIQVGVPINRTVKIAAQGILATNLPLAFTTSVAGFEIYPDKPNLNNSSDGQHVFATRVQTAAYIPTKAGQLTLPPITINWWDSTNGIMRTATLPGKTLQIRSGASKQNPVMQGSFDQNITPTLADNLWLIGGMAILLGGGTMIIIYYRKRTAKKLLSANDIALRENINLKEAKYSVEQAVKRNNLADFIAALIVLAQKIWPDSLILSLGDIKAKCHTIEAKHLCDQLDALRYSEPSFTWDAEKTWKILWAELQQEKKSKKSDAPILPTLYLKE